MPPPTSNPRPATPASIRSWPRSNCGSKSNSPRPGSSKARAVLGQAVLKPGGSGRCRPAAPIAHGFRREKLPPYTASRLQAILSVTTPRYIRRARADPFRPPCITDGLNLEKLKNYRPSEKEPFMNDRQRDYFRGKLLAWKDEILRESRITLQTLQEENVNHPDLADRASSETDRAIELRARDRQRKLISKIDAALQRIDDNTYGYCEETGEPIALKRLEARPIATLSVEAQERHEKREKVYRDE